MKTTAFMFILLAITRLSPAQETKTERQSPATAYDAKANSDSVPDVYATTGQFERVVVIGLKNKADLLAGLEQGMKENGIRKAIILAGIGSVISYHYLVALLSES